MFIGEASCLIVFEIVYYYHKLVKKNVSQFGAQKFSCFVFMIPAICDVLGTSTLYVGLSIQLSDVTRCYYHFHCFDVSSILWQ